MRVAVLSANPKSGGGGYSNQCGSLLERLATHPAVDALALASLRTSGTPPRDTGYDEYPLGMDLPDGNPRWCAAVARRLAPFAPDVVISLLDVRFLGRLAPALAPAEWWAWVPVDCEPASPHDVAALQGCHKAIAMARFGEAQLQAAGVANVIYIPLGVESDFVVWDEDARRAYRAQLAGADCTHLTLIVGANTHGDRKNLPAQIAAWWAFSQRHKGAKLYLHTGDRRPGAPDLRAVVRELGIGDKVIFGPDAAGRLSTDEMVRLYNSSDLLMLVSRGEGVGLPVLEAQACGVPCIATNASAQPELLRWGKLVAVEGTTYEPPLGAYWAQPAVDGILFALEELFAEQQACGGRWPMAQRRSVSAAVHSEFGWDHVFREMWSPLVHGLSVDSVALSAGISGG